MPTFPCFCCSFYFIDLSEKRPGHCHNVKWTGVKIQLNSGVQVRKPQSEYEECRSALD